MPFNKVAPCAGEAAAGVSSASAAEVVQTYKAPAERMRGRVVWREGLAFWRRWGVRPSSIPQDNSHPVKETEGGKAQPAQWPHRAEYVTRW